MRSRSYYLAERIDSADGSLQAKPDADPVSFHRTFTAEFGKQVARCVEFNQEDNLERPVRCRAQRFKWDDRLSVETGSRVLP